MQHPDIQQLRDFSLEQLSPQETTTIGKHLVTCDHCRDFVRRLTELHGGRLAAAGAGKASARGSSPEAQEDPTLPPEEEQQEAATRSPGPAPVAAQIPAELAN